GTPDSTETIAGGIPHAAEGRRGPTWRGGVLTIIAAVLLSVTATLLLGGSGVFRSDTAIAPAVGHGGSGTGSDCCPRADAGK
ncbi:MAG TPA: hypothetical protein VHM71_04275, partial [Candidatus Deferrimicrobium sp.]|nr:hypothetical protein [Candidatus Deferrimicrobium sp.]